MQKWHNVQIKQVFCVFIFEDKNLGYMFKSTGAWAYIINKRACRYILDNFSYMRDRLAIDNIIPILNMRGFKSFMTPVNVIDHCTHTNTMKTVHQTNKEPEIKISKQYQVTIKTVQCSG